MPRKKPIQPARRQYSKDLKMRVIHQAFTLGKTSTQIAIDLDMPVRVVQRVKRTWAELGEVCRDRRHKGRAPMLSTGNTKVSDSFSYQFRPNNLS
jgi:transposase-like protein